MIGVVHPDGAAQGIVLPDRAGRYFQVLHLPRSPRTKLFGGEVPPSQRGAVPGLEDLAFNLRGDLIRGEIQGGLAALLEEVHRDADAVDGMDPARFSLRDDRRIARAVGRTVQRKAAGRLPRRHALPG